MKFTCEKDLITREISIAQEIISSRNVMSILSNVLLEASNDRLLIKATDLKVGFETSIPVQVESPGSGTIFCDKLLGVLRSLHPYPNFTQYPPLAKRSNLRTCGSLIFRATSRKSI